jgi:predicted N-acetyltransferase YhbS
MNRDDLTAVSHLMDMVFGAGSPLYPNWQEVLEWMYFSSEIKDQIPRAFVIADEHSVIGHIGLTLSEFTNGDQSFSVVQTANWVVAPGQKVGLLSLRLMQEAISLGEAAIILGGAEDTHRLIPKLGFKKRLDVDRYVKVIKPAQFLSMSRSGKKLVRNAGKLAMFLANSPLSIFRVSGESQRVVYHPTEGHGHYLIDCPDPGADAIFPPPRRVLRNTLNADFLNWYQQFPQGKVHVLKFYGEGQAPAGQATVLIQSRKGNCYANLVNVDTGMDDPSAWSDILRGAEQFLRDKGVTHINTVATFEPLLQALKENGYCRVNRLPLWVRDKNNRLSGVEAWHITAIEGDLGYLFE